MKYLIAIVGAFALLFFSVPTANALSPIACPEIWAPVCGAQQVQCVRAPCYPVYKTYSSTCFLSAEKAVLIHEGECSVSETGPYQGGGDTSDGSSGNTGGAYTPPQGCMSWFDGCNSCSRATKNDPAMCTMMACTNEQKPGYCRSYDIPEDPTDDDTSTISPDGGTVNSPPAQTAGAVPSTSEAAFETTEKRGFFAHILSYITSWFSLLF